MNKNRIRESFSPQTVFKHAGVPVDFDVHYLSEVSFGQSEPLEDVVAAVRKTGICLKGHFSVPEHSRSGERESMSMQFKKELDLFGNVAVIKSRPGIRARHQNVDMVIVREQIEGECEFSAFWVFRSQNPETQLILHSDSLVARARIGAGGGRVLEDCDARGVVPRGQARLRLRHQTRAQEGTPI